MATRFSPISKFRKAKTAERKSKQNLGHLQRRLAAENTIRDIRKNHPNLKIWQQPMDKIRGKVQKPGTGKFYTAYTKELKRIQTAQKNNKGVATRFKEVS